MNQKKANKSQQLLKSIQSYCDEYLDKEYKKLCTKAFKKLQKESPDVFKRGKQEVWAASIVWAVGRLNFLSDKSFEPYASLNDVCNYFQVKSSTVGNKAFKIMELIDMGYFDDDFLREDNEASKLLNNLAITEDGIIVPMDILEEFDEEEEIDVLEDNGSPEKYALILECKRKITKADVYQLEYIFKKILREGEKFIKAEITESRNVALVFFGDLVTIQNFVDKLGKTGFFLSDIQLIV